MCRKATSSTITFVFALIIIFLVLAAQFESLRDPLVILVSVPMSICGALMPLFFGVATMNIYTQVGLVTLIGLISKHGILMVEFANELQLNEGLDRRSAIESGGPGPAAPDPDDHGGDGHRPVPAVDRDRRRCGEPVLDRPRHRRRHVDRNAVHAVRAAGGLCGDRHRSPARRPIRSGQGDRGFRSGSEGAQADVSADRILAAATLIAIAAVSGGLSLIGRRQAAMPAFAALIGLYADDALAGFHLRRLLNGAKGVRMQLE